MHIKNEGRLGKRIPSFFDKTPKMKKLLIFLLVFSMTGTLAARERFDRGIVKRTFVPKGQWFAGGTFSYSQHTNDNYKFLVIDNWGGEGYTLSVRPFAGYTIANDIALGVSFAYDRKMLKLDDLKINLGEDLNFEIKDWSTIEHLYTGTAFMRTYINLGESRRFGLYNDVRFVFGGGQGRVLNHTGDELEGTHMKIKELGVMISPGMTVFINNFMAVEASIGVLGFKYRSTDQVTNQVYQGSRKTSSANFKIDILSIALGMAIYF